MHLKRLFPFIFALSLLFSVPAWGQEHNWYFFSPGDFIHSSRPDGHAPIGVMGDHVHHQGEWMTSFRFMRMNMDGMRNGTDSLSSAEILNSGYMVTPTQMTMDMYMFGVMYAPANFVTLMAMMPLVEKNMDLLTAMGGTFSTQSFGIGDTKLMGLFPLVGWKKQRLQLQFGLSFPTGPINKSDNTPMGIQTLPYPMQLGSGSWDLLPGLTYIGQSNRFSWGVQVAGVAHLNDNSHHYRFGNQLTTNAWGAVRWNDWLSNSIRLEGLVWGNVSGADSALNPNIVPTADPHKQGGQEMNLMFGLNFFIPKGKWYAKGQRIAIEGGIPVYQSLDGPQMERSWSLIVGWQWSIN